MLNHFFQKNPLSNVRKIDCSLLPPTRSSLLMKLKRTLYVTKLWTRASEPNPTVGLSPSDFGWHEDDDGSLVPEWFSGPVIPEDLFPEVSEEEEESDITDTDDDPWTEDSDFDTEPE